MTWLEPTERARTGGEPALFPGPGAHSWGARPGPVGAGVDGETEARIAISTHILSCFEALSE